MVELDRVSEVDAFLAAAGAFLEAREAEHNLLFGICAHLRRDPTAYGSPPYLAVVSDGGHVVGAAIRTPPYDLVLSEMSTADPVEAVAIDAAVAFPDLGGVMGPPDVSRAFADIWERERHRAARVAMQQRIYRASSARVPAAVPGRMRPFGHTDRQLVVRWLGAFADEALSERDVHEDPSRLLDRRLDDPEGGILVWEDDDRIVSLAGFGTPTPNGVRVGPVYTPPELRRRGYASGLVGTMTARLLERHRLCFLFTDRANPTSNAIYQRVGYEPVGDVDQYRFEGGGQRAASTTRSTAE